MSNQDKIALEQLGQRICILGPSNSGKSTLNYTLAQKLGVPGIHLDQVAHIPNTAWERRPDEEFIAEHDKLIAQDGWVIDGNYSVTMEKRLARATSVIWLDPNLLTCIWRYLIRCRKDPDQLFGRLDGATREFSWGLIHWTLRQYPKNRLKYKKFLEACQNIPVIKIGTMRELNAYYKAWGLTRPIKPA